jgi:molybdopterin-containing oxidoreductase family iron-sulfur binding subunit
LDNIGKTVLITAPTEVKPSNQSADFKKLVEEMHAGKVDALFILGVNPAYTSPIDLDFKGALSKVRTKVHVGQRLDETGILCEWHFNEAHYLETWGDGRGHDGTVTICQPLMAALYDGKSSLELLTLLTGNGLERTAQSPREIVKQYWAKNWKSGTFSEVAWEKALQEGIVPGTASAAVAKAPTTNNLPAAKAASGGVELNFRADPTLYDGAFANNGWMLELPKPVTKLTWDNAIILSPKLAKAFGVDGTTIKSTGGGEHGRATVDMAELKIGKYTLKAAVWIQPKMADDSITIHLGSGRDRAGKVGN